MKNITRCRYGGGNYKLHVSLKVGEINPYIIPISEKEFNDLSDNTKNYEDKNKSFQRIIDRNKDKTNKDGDLVYDYLSAVSDFVKIRWKSQDTLYIYAYSSLYSTINRHTDITYDSADEFLKALLRKQTNKAKVKTQKSKSKSKSNSLGGRRRTRHIR
jgi:hypothetical protein